MRKDLPCRIAWLTDHSPKPGVCMDDAQRIDCDHDMMLCEAKPQQEDVTRTNSVRYGNKTGLRCDRQPGVDAQIAQAISERRDRPRPQLSQRCHDQADTIHPA